MMIAVVLLSAIAIGLLVRIAILGDKIRALEYQIRQAVPASSEERLDNQLKKYPLLDVRVYLDVKVDDFRRAFLQKAILDLGAVICEAPSSSQIQVTGQVRNGLNENYTRYNFSIHSGDQLIGNIAGDHGNGFCSYNDSKHETFAELLGKAVVESILKSTEKQQLSLSARQRIDDLRRALSELEQPTVFGLAEQKLGLEGQDK